MSNLSYTAVCIALGLALGWLPGLVHGPIAEKWDVHAVSGAVLVWGYYAARLSIGLWVGITSVPSAWYLRGPLCGALAMLPLGFVGLANPLCGSPCMFWNTVTGATVGFAVGALAWSITGRHHAHDAGGHHPQDAGRHHAHDAGGHHPQDAGRHHAHDSLARPRS